MPFPHVRSFQGRIFLAILGVALVPAALGLGTGLYVLRSIGRGSGTLGAWESVAESGVDLLDAVEKAEVSDPQVGDAAARHREALSESVRLSRLYAFVADRFLRALPAVTILAGLFSGGLAYLAARRLSQGFGRPVSELAGWTERIAREEPLPSAEADDRAEVEELATLREALRRMAGQLEEGRRRAVESARMRSWTDLARRVAHELKNPLTPMRMAAATLSRGRSGPEAEAGRVLVEEIGRLDEMARSFARFGRMPEGPTSRVDLAELLSSLAVQHGTAAFVIETHGEQDVMVNGHFDAIERAFRNLVVNAMEAQEGRAGRLDISVGREGRFAVVRLQDSGPGVPPELLDDIWSPDVTTKSHGTGLGLAIVRQTVAHHDGTVDVRNRPEGGAAFTVRLPLTEPSPDGAAWTS